MFLSRMPISPAQIDMSFSLIDILKKNWKRHKKCYADYVFNALDVSIKIHQRVDWPDHATGNKVLSCQLRHLPVNPGQAPHE